MEGCPRWSRQPGLGMALRPREEQPGQIQDRKVFGKCHCSQGLAAKSWKSRIIVKSCPARSITDKESRCYGCSCFHEGYALPLPLVAGPVAQPCHSKCDLAGMTSECAQEAPGCSPRQLGGGFLRALPSGVI